MTAPRPRASQRGMTLFEIMIVIVIIAVAAAVALPNITAGARQREVRQTMQRFVSAVRQASSVAVFERQVVSLRIDTEERSYSVSVPGRPEEEGAEDGTRRIRPPSRSADESVDKDSNDVRLQVVLPEIAKFGEIEGAGAMSQDGLRVRFYPNGGSSGGTVEFVFDTGENREQTYSLVINRLTSEISFADEDDT